MFGTSHYGMIIDSHWRKRGTIGDKYLNAAESTCHVKKHTLI